MSVSWNWPCRQDVCNSLQLFTCPFPVSSGGIWKPVINQYMVEAIAVRVLASKISECSWSVIYKHVKLCRLVINASSENKWEYSWTSVIRPSVIRISLLSGHDLAVYCLLSILSIFNYSLAQDKNKVVNICFILLSNPFYMSDNLLQIE